MLLFKLKVVYYWLLYSLRRPFRSRAALSSFQDKKLRTFARRTLRKSTYYQPFFKEEDLDFNTIPLLTKEVFNARFDDINTVGIKRTEALEVALQAEQSRNFKDTIRGITIGLSTGTSGQRSLFLASKNERASWAALVMSRVIRPRPFRRQRIAFFLRANSNLYASVASRLFEFRYFDLFQPMDTLLKEVQEFKPDILAAPPSVLIDIAAAMKGGRIRLSVHQVISFAEVLHPGDKTYIETNLQATITEVYQCTEGFLGVSCAYGTMHLNEDFIKVEKEPLGERRFHPILTDFSRKSQPVVRYLLNDVLIERATPCPCGSPMLALEGIIGRDDDVLCLDGVRIYPDLIARRIALESADFYQYQIGQTGKNELHIYIDAPEKRLPSVQQAFKRAIVSLLEEKGISGTQLVFQNQIDREAGSKWRKIIRYEDYCAGEVPSR